MTTPDDSQPITDALRVDPPPTCSASEKLAEYFDSQYPNVIDHAGRAEKLEDGTWHFYLHPDGVNGDTIDLWIGPEGITLSKQNAHVDTPLPAGAGDATQA